MMIKITDKTLSIPPYLSTCWSRVTALHMKGGILAITIIDGNTIYIPNLPPETIDLIFQHHSIYLEKEQSIPTFSEIDFSKLNNSIDKGDSSIRLAFGSSMDGLGTMMQHNPNQKDAPSLPPEVLQKIQAISKIISPSEEMTLPQPQENCNCFYCQIARVLNPEHCTNSSQNIDDLVIADEELQFQQWEIQETGPNLYSVANKLDESEKYNVFLGQPLGCTCGKQGCEHILAVLKS